MVTNFAIGTLVGYNHAQGERMAARTARRELE